MDQGTKSSPGTVFNISLSTLDEKPSHRLYIPCVENVEVAGIGELGFKMWGRQMTQDRGSGCSSCHVSRLTQTYTGQIHAMLMITN